MGGKGMQPTTRHHATTHGGLREGKHIPPNITAWSNTFPRASKKLAASLRLSRTDDTHPLFPLESRKLDSCQLLGVQPACEQGAGLAPSMHLTAISSVSSCFSCLPCKRSTFQQAQEKQHWVKELGTEAIRYPEWRCREETEKQGGRQRAEGAKQTAPCPGGASAVLGWQWASRYPKRERGRVVPGTKRLILGTSMFSVMVQFPPPPSMSKPAPHHVAFFHALFGMYYNQGNPCAL